MLALKESLPLHGKIIHKLFTLWSAVTEKAFCFIASVKAGGNKLCNFEYSFMASGYGFLSSNSWLKHKTLAKIDKKGPYSIIYHNSLLPLSVLVTSCFLDTHHQNLVWLKMWGHSLIYVVTKVCMSLGH